MSWKSFKFFDLEEVKDPDTNQAYDKLKVGTSLLQQGKLAAIQVKVNYSNKRPL